MLQNLSKQQRVVITWKTRFCLSSIIYFCTVLQSYISVVCERWMHCIISTMSAQTELENFLILLLLYLFFLSFPWALQFTHSTVELNEFFSTTNNSEENKIFSIFFFSSPCVCFVRSLEIHFQAKNIIIIIILITPYVILDETRFFSFFFLFLLSRTTSSNDPRSARISSTSTTQEWVDNEETWGEQKRTPYTTLLFRTSYFPLCYSTFLLIRFIFLRRNSLLVYRIFHLLQPDRRNLYFFHSFLINIAFVCVSLQPTFSFFFSSTYNFFVFDSVFFTSMYGTVSQCISNFFWDIATQHSKIVTALDTHDDPSRQPSLCTDEHFFSILIYPNKSSLISRKNFSV